MPSCLAIETMPGMSPSLNHNHHKFEVALPDDVSEVETAVHKLLDSLGLKQISLKETIKE